MTTNGIQLPRLVLSSVGVSLIALACGTLPLGQVHHKIEKGVERTMIVDRLENAGRYVDQHRGFRAAFEFLKKTDIRDLADGRYDIDGMRVYALVSRVKGHGVGEAKLEAHRKYIDIQYIVAGNEVIGFRPTAECSEIATPYDAEKDIVFFADKSQTWLTVPPGSFAIFYPEDAHAPLCGEGEVQKVVVKIAVNWLQK